MRRSVDVDLFRDHGQVDIVHGTTRRKQWIRLNSHVTGIRSWASVSMVGFLVLRQQCNGAARLLAHGQRVVDDRKVQEISFDQGIGRVKNAHNLLVSKLRSIRMV